MSRKKVRKKKDEGRFLSSSWLQLVVEWENWAVVEERDEY